MKVLLFIILLVSNFSLFSQTLDPYKFFPSCVGNVWEYDQVWGFAREEIYKDSISEYGTRYLFYKYNDYYTPTPRYKIDTTTNIVYRIPFNPSNPHLLYFKLDADTGDVWIVDSLNPGAGPIYQLALFRSMYDGFYLGHFTTFKEITFYQYQSDTIINEFSWPDFTITLAYGIGEIMEFDEEGGGPQRILQGCIIDGDTIGIITSAEDELNALNTFELYQNYPNPFNPNTTIKFSLNEPQKVKLTIYSFLGEEIKVLIDEYKSSGTHSIVFNANDLSSGVYIYTIVAGNRTSSKKLILLK